MEVVEKEYYRFDTNFLTLLQVLPWASSTYVHYTTQFKLCKVLCTIIFTMITNESHTHLA